MIDYPISPISLGGFCILSFAVDYDETATANETDLERNFTIEFSVITSLERQDDGLSKCTCILSLQCDISKDADSENDVAHLGRLSTKMLGSATGRFAPEELDEAVRDTLEANAVSFLYAKARTYIELMTAYCPGGSISLPAIMPVPKQS